MPAKDVEPSLDLPKRAVALILAGGRGSRRHHLTERRAKPAVYFGGKFRIVDFALSNCRNSGIRRIGVITQCKSHSLLRHLQRGWAFLKTEMNEFYALMLADHVAKGRACTVACIEVSRDEARAFGVMAVDAQWNITDFVEKPSDPPCVPGSTERCLASMGIYIFNAKYLYDELERDMADPTSTHDFGKDIIPRAVRLGQAAAHPFAMSCVTSGPGEAPYWRDVGTIDSCRDANIDLTATEPLLNLYDRRWPVWTYPPQLAPAKFVHNQPERRGQAVESLVSGGSIISGSVLRSVLFSSVRVHSYSNVAWSVLLPEVERGPQRAPVARGRRSWLPHSGRHGDRRGRRARRAALLPHRQRHRAGHAAHAGGMRHMSGLS